MSPSGAPALTLDQLSKRYGAHPVVQGVTLSVAPGQVYGFLGPNGAGKTTTIRMALGLVRPTGGSVRIFGENPREVPAIRRQVGLMVEHGAFYPHLTGAENLRLLALVRSLPIDRISERITAVLEMMGLASAGRARFRHYSSGMQARLGIAAALLHDPALLILDEPANGLDPQGMADLRARIGALSSQEGKAVFLSSHLLGEVEQICARVAILNRGKLVAEGTVTDLLGPIQTVRVTLEVDSGAAAQAAIAAAGLVAPERVTASAAEGAPERLSVDCARDQIPAIVAALVSAGLRVFAVTPQNRPLEAVFLELTGSGDSHEGHDARA